MDVDTDLWDKSGPLYEDVSQYSRLVDKLIYFTLTKPNIIYVGLVSKLLSLCTSLESFIEGNFEDIVRQRIFQKRLVV